MIQTPNGGQYSLHCSAVGRLSDNRPERGNSTMVLLSCDFLGLCYTDLEAAKRWWIQVFDCKQVKVPETWDCPLPSDVALKLPGLDEPSILLCDNAEVRQAGYDRPNGHSVIFCGKLQ